MACRGLFESLKEERDLKKHIVELGSGEEVTYLSWVLRCRARETVWECDPKRVMTLLGKCVVGGCRGKETSAVKDGPETSMGGELIDSDRASRVRIIANPTCGMEYRLKRAARYLALHPHGLLRYPCASGDQSLRIWIDIVGRRLAFAQVLQRRPHRGDSSLEQDPDKLCTVRGASFNTAVKRVSERFGVYKALGELFSEDHGRIISVDARTCQWMKRRITLAPNSSGSKGASRPIPWKCRWCIELRTLTVF